MSRRRIYENDIFYAYLIVTIKVIMKIKRNNIFLIFFTIFILFGNQGLALPDDIQQDSNWMSQLDISAKIFALIITILGIPLAFLQFKKTKAEIRKIELEAESLKEKNIGENVLDGHKINIEGSENVVVNILADPRFISPLLILLDFIIAWIILKFASYAFGWIFQNVLGDIALVLVAIILFVPIYREAQRVKKILRPSENNADKGELK